MNLGPRSGITRIAGALLLCESCSMLILDKTRALNLILWNAERITVPEQFLMMPLPESDTPAPATSRPHLPAMLIAHQPAAVVAEL